MTKVRDNLVGHQIHLSVEQDKMLVLIQEESGLNKSQVFREALFMIGCRYQVRVPRDGTKGGVYKRGRRKNEK